MQTGTSGAANAGVFAALSKTVRTEGIRGVYRGVSAPLVASTPIYAISFWGYDMGQIIVRKINNKEDDDNNNNTVTKRPLTIPEIMIAGGLSALPMIAVMTPSERIKCLLQVQTATIATKTNTNTNTNTNATSTLKSQTQQPPRYTGMIDCASKIYKSGGISSLYKGTMLTLMRDVPGSIAWFGTYEVIKRSLVQWQGIDDPSHLSPFAIMTAGGFAGMACWMTMIIPDTLKSRYQTAPDGKYPNGMRDVYRTLVKEEGYSALLSGFRPAMIRKLVFAFCFAFWFFVYI
jgi:solute carrier family 25 carnitine/acylcarnitine transporter 20/29